MSPPALPQHIAVIMDGNGRWAERKGRARAAGHQAGFHATRDIVENCGRRGIPALTLFAFSSENWKRPEAEVSRLMELFLGALKSEVGKLCENNVHLRFIGERGAFSPRLQKEMDRGELLTRDNTGLKLAIAVNYGGRWDILNACRSIAQRVQDGELSPDEIDLSLFSGALTLGDVPEPDLFIRTGGELRISNFLLWQLAYTELYFSDVLWPDFDDAELQNALDFFASRERRYGRTGKQVRTGVAGRSRA